MSDKINSQELDDLIKKKIKEKGLSNDISLDKFSEIKNNIKAQLKKPELSEVAPINEQPVATGTTVAPTDVKPANSPESITQTTTVSKDAIELAKREGELEQREQEFAQKQSELTVKEKELEEKEQALAYKPQVPAILENIGNENLFIFNENEISLGAEALSNAHFRLVSNPDDKRSMIELWATEGKKGANIYVVKFEKLGEIIFNPFEGTSTFAKKPYDEGEIPAETPTDGLTPADAQASQEPKEPMIDVVEPKVDVTLSPSNDMGLNSVNLENLLKKRLDDIIKNYFLEKYPKM